MRTLIQGGHLLTLADGPTPIRNGCVVVEDGEIRYAGPSPAPDHLIAGAEVIDVSDVPNAYILPGFVDCHMHLAHGGVDQREKPDADPLVALRFVHNAQKNLINGVTSVQDLGTKHHIDASYKQGIALGLVASPRVRSCGRPIIATAGHCHYMGIEVDGPYEARKAARIELKAGAEFLKMMVTGGVMTPNMDPRNPQLKYDEIEAVCQVAHDAGKTVTAHCQGGRGVQDAIRAGIDSLEHGLYLTEAEVELMVKHNVWYVPTLAAIYSIGEFGHLEPVPVPKWAQEKAKAAVPSHFKSFEMARKAGLRIAAGTDYKHGEFALEMELMMQGGFTAWEALQAGTVRSAEQMGWADRVGTLEPGKRGDITVIEGDPLANISNARKVRRVIMDGQLVVRDGWIKTPTSYKPH